MLDLAGGQGTLCVCVKPTNWSVSWVVDKLVLKSQPSLPPRLLKTMPQWTTLSWNLTIPAHGGATFYLCPSCYQVEGIKPWQQYSKPPMPVIPGSLNTMQVTLGGQLTSGTSGPLLGSDGQVSMILPWGFGSLFMVAQFRDSYPPKTARSHIIAFSTTVTLNELLNDFFHPLGFCSLVFVEVIKVLKTIGKSTGWNWCSINIM